ncbi:hypothetical protein GWK47_042689 [Chionoecetes opilio]|uniref:Ionotropic glutamate receptor C-terminal domain-containing protein n=1 Tax=Chionoecetes opilio TaxID=41210 RepID=A0A8J5CJQ8_CHIOP|nr:hypothetical protein GWK47_042689 [Chionoecetes opilio]
MMIIMMMMMMGQLIVGWWLLTAMVVTTAYRSSLVAHLSILSFPPPIDDMEDLVARPGWSWGSIQFSGTSFLFFNRSTDPATLEVHRRSEIVELEESARRVLAGGFSYIVLESSFKFKVEGLLREGGGEGHFHISSRFAEETVNGWGFRQGAPFLEPMSERVQWMVEGGLINRWITEISSGHAKDERSLRATSDTTQGSHEQARPTRVSYEKGDVSEVVFGLQHLQGAFCLLLLGHGIAFLTLLWERLSLLTPRHR